MRIVASLLLSALTLPAFAFTITTFNASAYDADVNQTNNNLGIDGSFVIEDFEDATLIGGLTVTDSFDGTGAIVFRSDHTSGIWDGTRGIYGHPSTGFRSPLFSFDTGVTRFGVGIWGYQPANAGAVTEFFVNGILQGPLPLPDVGLNFALRNGYLMIEAEAGETINSVSFQHPTLDGLGYDHLAISSTSSQDAIPAPAPLALIAAALLFVAAWRRSKTGSAATRQPILP